MSEEPQAGMPFGPFDLGDMMRMLQSEGPLNLAIAHQVARWVTLEGGDDPPIPEADAALMSDLTDAAQLQVRELTGLDTGPSGVARTVGRGRYGDGMLDALEPVLVEMARGLEQAGAAADPAGPEPDEANLFGVDFTELMGAMAPVLLGVQAGFMVGHLANRSLGRYEDPLPLSGEPAISYVGPNLDEFESGWELPREELRFYVALHECVHAAVRRVPWVRERLLRLGTEYVGAFSVDPRVIEDQLAGVDPNDPTSLESALGDPTALLGALRSPGQQRVLGALRDTVAIVEGYSDVVIDAAGTRMIPALERIREACHRHRVERGEAAKFLESLLGFELGRADYDRGAAFCRGVVERGGAEALGRLWEAESRLPTPSEMEAPGLWLERIDLPKNL